MKLVQLKLSKGILFGDRVNRIIKNQPKPTSNANSSNYYRTFSYYMKKLNVNSAVIGGATQLYRFEFGDLFAGFSSDSFTNLETETKRVLDRNNRNIISFASFKRQTADDDGTPKHLDNLNAYLKEIWTRISTGKSLCIVILTEPRNRFESGCFVRFSSGCFDANK